jgi:hypothetical protein
MIRYTMKCDQDHSFDSWFASGAALDKLLGLGQVSCPICGSSQVSKSIMAPQVRTSRAKEAQSAPPPAAKPDLSVPMSAVEEKLAALKAHVEKTSDYVGLSFASEARKMHEGEIEHRAIYGEAKPEDAKKLLEDGVPVAPLPFTPQRKTN